MKSKFVVGIAVTCLVVGIAIGFEIPRPNQVAALNPAASDRLRYANSQPLGRNMWSADIRHDDYFLREQLRIVEMLEQQCQTTRKDCKLAQTARQTLNKNLK
ncbi:hypothetical protein WBP06_24635 [Novosphingobium sp. BL-8H]|uniref:hypothetical protein n=1 Tax=Novosphingobium sp. BL-8H TaxID=3127640 RepID=UPI0037583C86